MCNHAMATTQLACFLDQLYSMQPSSPSIMQASHDAHGTVLDSLEDALTSHEIKSASSLVRAVECAYI